MFFFFAGISSSNEFFVPVKSKTFQSSEPTWKSFSCLAGTRCSIPVPPVPKRSPIKRLMMIIYKKVYDPCHGFACSWASFDGIQHVLKYYISWWSQKRFEWDVIYTITVVWSTFCSIGISTTHNNIRQLAWESYHSYKVLGANFPPESGTIIHAISSLQRDWRYPCSMSCVVPCSSASASSTRGIFR